MELPPEERAEAAAREQARAEEVAASLSALFLGAWDRNTDEAAAALEDAIQEATLAESDAGEEITDSEVQRLIGQLRPFLSQNMQQEVSDGLRQGIEASYTIGQETISVEAAVSVSVKDRQLKNFLQDNATFWIGNHYDQQVQERIQEAADNVLSTDEGTLGRRKAAQKFRETFEGEFQKSESYWQLLANDVTTKSREFGRVEGMVKAGIEEYAIDAILDRRTSDICRFLDGKVFEVEDAVEQRERFIEADEPQAIKEISPWLEADEIVDLSVDELAARGMLLPPFHGNCRSRIQAI